MNTDIIAAAHVHDVRLSGSLLAAAEERRLETARELYGAGHWVHADVIEGSYRGQAGLAVDSLSEIADVCADRLDVHLMVDAAAHAIVDIPEGIARITVQCTAQDDAADLLARARARSEQGWLAVDPARPGALDTAIRVRPDGILLMLLPPGQPGHHVDMQRLQSAKAITSLPIGVDGGVTASLIPHLAAAGIRYAVAGRALLGTTAATRAAHEDETNGVRG